MLKFIRNVYGVSIRIGLSRKGIALVRLSRQWRATHCELLAEVELSDDMTTPQKISAELSKLIKVNQCEGLPATVVLDDTWVRNFIATPPKNSRRLDDCRAAAHMRFHALYGDAIGDWHLEADWDPQYPFLVCAVPRELFSGLRQLAKECSLTLVSVQPQFVAAWNGWHHKLDAASWFGVAHDGRLTIGVIEQQRLCALRTTLLPEQVWSDPAWLPGYVSREALRLHIPAATSLQLCGEIAEEWETRKIGTIQCARLDLGRHSYLKSGLSNSQALAFSGLK